MAMLHRWPKWALERPSRIDSCGKSLSSDMIVSRAAHVYARTIPIPDTPALWVLLSLSSLSMPNSGEQSYLRGHWLQILELQPHRLRV